MSKWTKHKGGKNKLLEQRKAYAKINSRGRSKASVELMRQKESLQYYFARDCWMLSKKGILSPKGLTWDSVFERKWGTPLKVYVAAEQQRQRENVSVRNIQSDPDLP